MEFNIQHGKVALKYIKLKAPDIAGTYDIQANMVTNPWVTLADNSFNTVTDVSNRVSIKVVQ